MNLTLRAGKAADAVACGRICYDAFAAIAQTHNFPPELPSVAAATELVGWMLINPRFHSVIAEIDGKIVGSNFLDERNPIAGVGPITVEPVAQNKGIGRRLMQHVMDRATQKQFPGVRLVLTAYHARSLSLYTKLGFRVREPLAVMQGPALHWLPPGYAVRSATPADIVACNRLCQTVHGFIRGGELDDMIKQGNARIVEREGRITGYASLVGFFGHAVGETNADLEALLGNAATFPGLGFLLPTRNTDLFRWCLAQGLRVVLPMTLMTLGAYNDPKSPFLPAGSY